MRPEVPGKPIYFRGKSRAGAYFALDHRPHAAVRAPGARWRMKRTILAHEGLV
jgi:hypothetical protein